MHNHQHKCVCTHQNLKYCVKCQRPYCVDCGMEWGTYPNYYTPYYYYTTYTVQPTDYTPTIMCDGGIVGCTHN
jgi:hypothetical protein